jgi:hypothetical protein
VVDVAPIDAMSVAAVERLRAETLYLATAGGMGPATLTALEMQLRDFSARSGVLVTATDSVRAGEGANLSEMTRSRQIATFISRT